MNPNPRKLRVGSRIVISQPSEDYICEVVKVVPNPKVNGLQMDYYILEENTKGKTNE